MDFCILMLKKMIGVKHLDSELQNLDLIDLISERHTSLKASLEKKIADKIGANQVKILKDILKSDWGLPND